MPDSKQTFEASEEDRKAAALAAKGAAKATKSTLQTELVPLVLKFFKGFTILSGVWLIGYYRYYLQVS